jgi:hypothetical protein
MAKDDRGKNGKARAAPDPDDIMAIGDMRPMLKLAKGGKPISAAVGLSADGDALILLHKQANPKQLRGQLIDRAEEIGLEIDKRSVRYGRAAVSDDDETTLRLTINREPSGSVLERELKRRVKPAGFSNVVLTADPSIDNEMDASAEIGQQQAPSAPSATDARPMDGVVRIQKSRLAWIAARKRVATELATLKKAIEEDFEGDPDEDHARDVIEQLDDVLMNFDDALTDKLDEALNATDDAARTKLNNEATKIIARYIVYLKSSPIVMKLEGDTPFGIKLSVAPTIVTTLKILGAQLK